MSKKKKTSNKVTNEVVEESFVAENVAAVDTDANISSVDEQKETKEKQGKNKVVEVKAKDVAKNTDKKKKDKTKKPNKVAKALKDTGNELKKVSWPKFSQVVKQTGVVMVVVIVFTLVLFGFDRLCSWLTTFFVLI